MTAVKHEYEITVTSTGDKIRHRAIAIVLDRAGNVLVDMDGWMHCPEFPGGGVDAGETILNAAIRELMEEAGWIATDGYVYSCPGDWMYRVAPADIKDIHTWNCEDNNVVIFKAGEFKPTHAFGSEGDALKCKMVSIGEVATALKRRLAGGVQARHRIKNELILKVLEEILSNKTSEPKWSKW